MLFQGYIQSFQYKECDQKPHDSCYYYYLKCITIASLCNDISVKLWVVCRRKSFQSYYLYIYTLVARFKFVSTITKNHHSLNLGDFVLSKKSNYCYDPFSWTLQDIIFISQNITIWLGMAWNNNKSDGSVIFRKIL